MFDRDLERFLGKLARLRSENATNPYDRSREGRRRLGNLRTYLAHFPDGCEVLLVAEAYGYRGGRVTGVPLSSEAVVESHPHFRSCFPTLASSYIRCCETGAKRTESTASIVWRVFAEIGHTPPPCCWNIVPLHPYDPGRGPWSNRRPTSAEIDAGAAFCVELIKLVRPRLVVAVGKCAARGLSKAAVDHVAIRHPSQGGAAQFRSQLLELMSHV